MLLAPVSRGNTENTSVLVTGIHQNTAILLTGRYPKYFVIAILKKSHLREVGAEYTPGSSGTPRHSILGGPFNIHKPFK